MNETLQMVLVIVGIVSGILVVLALSIPYIGGARYKAAIDALEVTVAAQERNLNVVTKELAEVKASDAAKGEIIAQMRQQIQTLKEQRPSQELITEMAGDIKENTRDVKILLSDILEKVSV